VYTSTSESTCTLPGVWSDGGEGEETGMEVDEHGGDTSPSSYVRSNSEGSSV